MSLTYGVANAHVSQGGNYQNLPSLPQLLLQQSLYDIQNAKSTKTTRTLTKTFDWHSILVGAGFGTILAGSVAHFTKKSLYFALLGTFIGGGVVCLTAKKVLITGSKNVFDLKHIVKTNEAFFKKEVYEFPIVDVHTQYSGQVLLSNKKKISMEKVSLYSLVSSNQWTSLDNEPDKLKVLEKIKNFVVQVDTLQQQNKRNMPRNDWGIVK